MSIDLTQDASAANQQSSKTPNIVVSFKGIDTVFGAVAIQKTLEYGDGVEFGDAGLVYGGKIDIDDQEDLITLSGGTTTNITNNVDIDKGRGNSIQSMQIAFVDVNNILTDIISPGNQVSEFLGLPAKVHYGFSGTSYPDDYFRLFKGNVQEIDSSSGGSVVITLAHPDYKKKANLFTKAETEANGAITNVQTSINVADASDFYEPVTGPDGTIDTSIQYAVKIGDEVIRYEGITGNQFTSCTRGWAGTTAAAHIDLDGVESVVILNGNVVSDIALKLMLSGRDGPYEAGIAVESFGNVGGTTTADSIYFSDLDIVSEYNVVAGDFVTTTGATNPANDITLIEILSVVSEGGNSWIIVDTTMTEELSSSATIDFRSQYDTWGAGRGMSMHNDDVDIAEHLRLFNTFFAGFDYELYIKDSVDNGKDLLDSAIYNPAGAFSLIRKAKSSMGVHAPPLPTDQIYILNNTNVKNASKLRIKRSLSKNFYNGIVYKFDDSSLEDKFYKTVGFVDGDSATRFGAEVPPSYLVVEAPGLRSSNNGEALANSASLRRLKTYRYGAEFIGGVQVTLEGGISLEPGDVLLLDLASLNVSDIQSGTRDGEPRLFRVEKKQFNIRTGQITVDLTDTNFEKDVRYGLIGPASFVKAAGSETDVTISPSFNTDIYGANEFLKWQSYVGAVVQVRSLDFVTVGTAQLMNASGNALTLGAGLGFTPTAGMIMEFADYDELGSDDVVDIVKLSFASLSDDDNDFTSDSKPAYRLF